VGAPAPRLLDEVRRRLRLKHYSLRTEQAYLGWIRRFIVLNGKRHPRAMVPTGVERFLSDLAVRGQVAASTQNQGAVGAAVSLSRGVVHRSAVAGQRGARQAATAFADGAVARRGTTLAGGAMDGRPWLIASLLYGTGMRVRVFLRA